MLVLSRKKSQEIVIGDDIVVMVVEIRGDKVRLGVKAPSHIRVDRREVRDSILASGTALESLVKGPTNDELRVMLQRMVSGVKAVLDAGKSGEAGEAWSDAWRKMGTALTDAETMLEAA